LTVDGRGGKGGLLIPGKNRINVDLLHGKKGGDNPLRLSKN